MAKKKQLKSVACHLPMYGLTVQGMLGWSPEDTKKAFLDSMEIESPFLDGCDGRTSVFRHPEHGMQVVIYLARWDEEPETIALLAHECLHAVLLIYKDIGQGIDVSDHEHLTYLHQHVFQTLWHERRNA